MQLLGRLSGSLLLLSVYCTLTLLYFVPLPPRDFIENNMSSLEADSRYGDPGLSLRDTEPGQ